MAGVISRGIQGPIIREGDDIVDIVVKSVYASEQARAGGVPQQPCSF